MEVSQKILGLFNSLSGILDIGLTLPKVEFANTMMEFADPAAKISSIKFAPTQVYKNSKFRDLKPDELDLVVFSDVDYLDLRSNGHKVRHYSKDYNINRVFTIKNLINMVEKTERQTRGKTDWFGGIDTHHVYFEGIHQVNGGNIWDIYWGS